MTCLNNEQIKKLEKQASNDEYRLNYHLMPPTGWLNDPNGLCQFEGIYHLYYQYAPDDCFGGDKYWGHYSTKDFITFKNEPVALFPDCSLDAGGAYSGSTIIKDNKMYVYYTGNVKYPGKHDYIHTGRDHNTIMVISDDGINFGEKVCLMKNDDYPDDLTLHVRDPQIIKNGDHYYMILGARTNQDVGCCLLYRSDDLVNYKLVNRIISNEPFGYMWECPNLVKFDEQMILFCCPQGVETAGYDYGNLYQNGYYLINGDLEKDYRLSEFIEFDHGFDYYAPQLFIDEQGRTIIIGWMGMPDVPYTNPTTKYNWQHAFTLPRELTFKNNKVYQLPISETKSLRKAKEIINLSNHEKISCKGNIYELYLPINNRDFTLTLRNDAVIDYHSNLLTFSMGASGYGRDSRHIVIDDLSNMTIYSDTSSLEIFFNDGEYALTTRIYDHSSNLEISIDTEIQCTYYELNSYQIV